MEYNVEARIELKPGVVDAEGETVQKSLTLLGFPAKRVRSIKVYEATVEAATREDALRVMEESCRKLLANPVIQDYYITLKE